MFEFFKVNGENLRKKDSLGGNKPFGQWMLKLLLVVWFSINKDYITSLSFITYVSLFSLSVIKD